jgi:hypothetical protein
MRQVDGWRALMVVVVALVITACSPRSWSRNHE